VAPIPDPAELISGYTEPTRWDRIPEDNSSGLRSASGSCCALAETSGSHCLHPYRLSFLQIVLEHNEVPKGKK
jgi:hypothetical protein